MRHLYLVNETARGSNYGVGTYIKQLIFALKGEAIELHVIQLNSMEHKKLYIEYKDGIQYLFIPTVSYGYIGDFGKMQKRYYQNAFYLLLPYINKQDDLIFHFNFMEAQEMLKLIKDKLNCKIVLTVHFMSWSFDLLGDTVKLQKALDNSETPEEENIKKSVEKEKLFIDNCDKIIAIARHSYDSLKDIYDISENKITLISNGLEDQISAISDEERFSLRTRYGLSFHEIVIIFAGRLDPIKGGGILLEAFKGLLTQHKNIRLFIVGEGDFKSLLEKASPSWAKVVFTGFICKEELYKLYSIADIGVVPSLHEEFGYVALEMMMMKLPLVVNYTTGLSEMVEDEVNGLTVKLNSNEDQMETSAKMLETKLLTLVSDESLRKQYGTSGRNRFLDLFEIRHFSKKMLNFYQGL